MYKTVIIKLFQPEETVNIPDSIELLFYKNYFPFSFKPNIYISWDLEPKPISFL